MIVLGACFVPTSGYNQDCTRDADCPSALSCILTRPEAPSVTECSAACDTASDCPDVPSDHRASALISFASAPA
jgi:hypothetical protein